MKALGRDMAEQHRRLAEAQRLAMVGSFEMDLDSGEIEWSAELRRIFDIHADERPAASAVIERLHPEDLEGFVTSISAWMQEGSRRYERTFRIICSDGAVRHVHMRASSDTERSEGRVVTGTVQDVTDRVTSEEARRTAEAQFSLAFDQGAIGMLTTTLDRVITRVNPALCELLGRSEAEILGRTPDAFADPDDLAAGQQPLLDDLLASPKGRIDADRRYVRPDGSPVYVRTYLTLVRDPDGNAQYVFGQLEDVTERKRQEDEIRRLVLEDRSPVFPAASCSMTGSARIPPADAPRRRQGRGPSRRDRSFQARQRFSGPAAGDRLLMQAARRMADGMRAHDTVARLTGDEFVLLFEGVRDVEHARALSDRLSGLFAEPFILDEDEITLTVSCGITLASGSERPEDLLRDAEAAMHRAKENGRGRSEVFDEAIRQRATGRLALEAALRHALDRDEIQVAFQPIIRFPEEAIVGVEALALDTPRPRHDQPHGLHPDRRGDRPHRPPR